jgi:hypothetical protein
MLIDKFIDRVRGSIRPCPVFRALAGKLPRFSLGAGSERASCAGGNAQLLLLATFTRNGTRKNAQEQGRTRKNAQIRANPRKSAQGRATSREAAPACRISPHTPAALRTLRPAGAGISNIEHGMSKAEGLRTEA